MTGFSIFWTVMTIALIIIEANTAYLVSIWFAAGAFAALISSLFEINFLWQLLIFITFTIILLLVTKPLVKKLRKKNEEKTNIDAIIGKTAIVTEKIGDNNSTGTVKLDGKTWTARSKNGNDIEAGTLVTVEEISGVKLIVNIKED